MDTEPLLPKETRNILELAKTVFLSFLYWAFIIFPVISEIIVLTQINLEYTPWILLICGSIQTLCSIIGALFMGYYWSTGIKDIWCTSPISPNAMITGGYTFYSLPHWILGNIIASWAFVPKVHIVWYIHLSVYTPIILYVPFVAIGYRIGKFYKS